jgi:hypothetical protein
LESFKTCLDYGKWIYFMKSWLLVIHNMIIEDERDHNFELLFDQANVRKLRCRLNFQTYMEGNQELENSQTHFNLILDLVDTCGPWRTCTNLIQKNFLLRSHLLQYKSHSFTNLSNLCCQNCYSLLFNMVMEKCENCGICS